MRRLVFIALFLIPGVALAGSPQRPLGSYNDPLLFGMTYDEVARLVDAPLIYLSGSARLGALYGGADVERARLVSGRRAHHPPVPPRAADRLAPRLADAAVLVLTACAAGTPLERTARMS